VTEEGSGEIAYTHDARGALVSTAYADGRVEGRYPDEVGNLFETSGRSDREYGAAGELRIARTPDGAVALEYDARGRLVRRRAPKLGEWRYHWNDADQLVQVDRPDGTAVAMSYDALGRRLAKNWRGKKTCFVWDGDVPLHEWNEAGEVPTRKLDRAEAARVESLLATKAQLQRVFAKDWQARWDALLGRDEGFERVHAELRARERDGEPKAADDAVGPVLTWLFDPGSFAPMGRLSDGDAHSIVADHVGAPLVVLDGQGGARAQFVVDTYGRAQVAGKAELCPWRFAGQYADDETGLYYNRFRHYDPATGEYVSRDPLGLRGGLRAYGYVEDPTGWSDPLGLSSTGGAGEACGGDSEPRSPHYIPRTPEGEVVPLPSQHLHGEDIPLPDASAAGPHTTLGGRQGDDGVLYRQSATFPESTWPTADGHDVPNSRVDWHDHGRADHPNPHQHIFTYDREQRRWIAGPPRSVA